MRAWVCQPPVKVMPAAYPRTWWHANFTRSTHDYVGDAREPPRQSQESLPTGGGWARAHHLTTEDVRREVLPVLRIIVCEAWVVASQGATPGATLLLGASTPTHPHGRMQAKTPDDAAAASKHTYADDNRTQLMTI